MKSFSLLLLLLLICSTDTMAQNNNPLEYSFDKKYGQVEVGGPFVGLEFHKSRPLPSRISFYYPVANSIDLSTDYWKRDESRPLAFGIKIGNGKKQWLGRDGWKYTVSPHTVTFKERDAILSYQLTYDFCLTEPTMVVSLSLKNETTTPQTVLVYSHLLMVLRTCQTYARKDTADIISAARRESVIAQFGDNDTKDATVFALNAGVKPDKCWSDAAVLSIRDDGTSLWMDSSSIGTTMTSSVAQRIRGTAAFEYNRILQPGESMTIVQIIGSTSKEEAEKTITALAGNWQQQVELFRDLVRNASSNDSHFFTGDPVIDRTTQWSKAILTANAHYLDGKIVPMPCPAEYN
ncbi:MAG: hypothetical protein WCW40_04905, partial [Bacteroidota bacterium]